MKINNKLVIIGPVLIFLSICMGIWGAYMYSYKGTLTPFMNITGKYSFLLWLPTFITGLILTIVSLKK